MLLTDLPTDILVLLTSYMCSIDDLYSLISTCRVLHAACYDEKIKLPPVLRRRDGQYLYQPHPHLLIAGTARQVGDWAVQSSENRTAFHEAVRGGLTGLLGICQRVARMSFKDMRNLHEIKYSVLNPLTKKLGIENPKNDDDDSLLTQLEHPDLCILNLWIYSDLFHHSITASYRPVNVPAQLTDAIRLDYVKNCIPDENAGPLDYSTGQIQWLGELVDERNELRFQQLDLFQLRDTCLSYLAIHRFFYPGQSYRDLDTFAHDVLMVLFHSGLSTLRAALMLSIEADTEIAATQPSEIGSQGESFVCGSVKALWDIKNEMLACREDGRYWQTQANGIRDPLFSGIHHDCNELWDLQREWDRRQR